MLISSIEPVTSRSSCVCLCTTLFLTKYLELRKSEVHEKCTMSSFFKESDRIPSLETYLGDDNVNQDLSFHFPPVTEDLDLTLISNLQNKTSSEMDGISNKLLIRIKHIIVQPLTLFINQSLTSGIYPDKFKISKITLLHKKDDRTMCF